MQTKPTPRSRDILEVAISEPLNERRHYDVDTSISKGEGEECFHSKINRYNAQIDK